jgi:heme/copper-type cytochrome/quinol oxidase subunit 4
MAEIITWCFSKRAILKWLQVLCCLLAILFLIDGKRQWQLYQFIFTVDILLAILTIVTLVIYFMHIHRSNQELWVKIELAFNAVAALASIIFSGFLLYDYIKLENNEYYHHQNLPPPDIGKTGWTNRIRIVLFSQIMQSVFYLLSLYWAHRYGLN